MVPLNPRPTRGPRSRASTHPHSSSSSSSSSTVVLPPAVLRKQVHRVATTLRKTSLTHHKIPTPSSNKASTRLSNTILKARNKVLMVHLRHMLALRTNPTRSHHIRALRPNSSRAGTTRHSNPEQRIITSSSSKTAVPRALTDNSRPVREQNIIINSSNMGMAQDQIHTLEGSMRAPERTLTEVEDPEGPEDLARGGWEAHSSEGPQELLSAVSLELASSGVLSGALSSRTCWERRSIKPSLLSFFFPGL